MTVTIDLRSSHLLKTMKDMSTKQIQGRLTVCIHMDLINTTIAKQYTEHACSDLRRHF